MTRLGISPATAVVVFVVVTLALAIYVAIVAAREHPGLVGIVIALLLVLAAGFLLFVWLVQRMAGLWGARMVVG